MPYPLDLLLSGSYDSDFYDQVIPKFQDQTRFDVLIQLYTTMLEKKVRNTIKCLKHEKLLY